MSKKNKSIDVTYDALKNAISRFDRTETLELIKNGAMKEVPDEEKTEIIQKIILLKDQSIVAELVKNDCKLETEMLDQNLTNNSNKEFVSLILNKFKKSLDLSDKDKCQAFFNLACTTECVGLLNYMISNGMAVDAYSKLAAGPTGLIALVSKIKKQYLTEELIANLFAQATLSNNSKENIDALVKKGFPITAKDDDGNDAISLAASEIENTSYPKNRAGEMKKRQNQNGLTYLKKATKLYLNPEKKETKWLPFVIVGCVVVIVVAVVLTIVLVKNDSAGTESTSDVTSETIDVTDTDETTDSDTTTDSETSSTLSTDTSLVVEDGDTVNIDYTGYIDGEAFDGGSTDGAGADLVIGSGTYIDDFEDQLVGHNVGDEVDVVVTFPDDYGATDLAGKEATFEVTINGIYE